MIKMRILLSNDDGIHAPGIKAMYHELKKLGKVWVVAPLHEKSTTGHSLTLHKPLRIIPQSDLSPDFYAVTGSPADCIFLGIKEIMGGDVPDLVVSGINRGANLAQDVFYSGTVSAAREASMLGIPALAISLCVNFKKFKSESDLHYSTAAKLALKVLKCFQSFDLPKHTLLNMNVPDVPLKKVKGIELARQGFRHYSGDPLKRKDHRGRDYYWVGGSYKGFVNEAGTDCVAVEKGYASITPLRLDTTDSHYLDFLKQIPLEKILRR